MSVRILIVNADLTKAAILILFSMFLSGCKDQGVPLEERPRTISIAVQAAEASEASLQIRFATYPGVFSLSRNGTITLSNTQVSRDTIIIDQALLPRHEYRYVAYRLSGDARVDSSITVSLVTMDSTSQAFAWTIDSVGTESSILRDVAFVGNEIWAVGTIFARDSSGQMQRYNLARWNGVRWTVVPVLLPACDPNGNETGSGPADATSVFAFSPTDVWIAGFTSLARWNGQQFQRICLVPGYGQRNLTKLWGGGGVLYIVGTNGFVARFVAGSWQQISTGTNVDLTDIWATPDGSIVWACGWKDFQPTVLLKIVNGVCEKVYEDQTHLFSYRTDSLSGAIRSIWTNRNDKVYALSWYDLYDAPTSTHGQARARWRDNPNTWVDWRLRGNDVNDLVAVGFEARIWHFNGVSWKRFDDLVNPLDELLSVTIRGNNIAAVGWRYYNGIENFGIIYRGRR